MSDEIQVSVRTFDQATVIDLMGDVTTFAEEAINQAYQSISSDGASNIVFNFRENDYINSAGIAILIGIVTEARKRDQKLLMTGLSAHFQKIFRMVGLTQYADLHPSVDDALSALNGS
ncbi:STAS domain-containing protein [Anaerolineales bacterium HSG6]|nr:STAS domain-containing protein [Anaerolineales bacterium HSG6]MDM8530880.1 STAS domain-containing protein [Anaerolineales bacterium HSG25]